MLWNTHKRQFTVYFIDYFRFGSVLANRQRYFSTALNLYLFHVCATLCKVPNQGVEIFAKIHSSLVYSVNKPIARIFAYSHRFLYFL